MSKYYFYYYSYNGIICCGKRDDNSPKSPGVLWEVQIKKCEYGLLLEDLQLAYPLPKSNQL